MRFFNIYCIKDKKLSHISVPYYENLSVEDFLVFAKRHNTDRRIIRISGTCGLSGINLWDFRLLLFVNRATSFVRRILFLSERNRGCPRHVDSRIEGRRGVKPQKSDFFTSHLTLFLKKCEKHLSDSDPSGGRPRTWHIHHMFTNQNQKRVGRVQKLIRAIPQDNKSLRSQKGGLYYRNS